MWVLASESPQHFCSAHFCSTMTFLHLHLNGPTTFVLSVFFLSILFLFLFCHDLFALTLFVLPICSAYRVSPLPNNHFVMSDNVPNIKHLFSSQYQLSQPPATPIHLRYFLGFATEFKQLIEFFYYSSFSGKSCQHWQRRAKYKIFPQWELNPGPLDHHANVLLTTALNNHYLYKVMVYWF